MTSQIQSNPKTPPGAIIKYINVVQGRKNKPRSGQMKLWKTARKYTGLASHQIKMAARGPRKSNVVKKQHIVRLQYSSF